MIFLKSLHWYEWLLIGTLVTVLGVAAIVWNKYEKQLVITGGQAVENTVLTGTVKYQDESATITDTVVAGFVQEKDDEKAKLDKSREGVINDYLSMAGQSGIEIKYPIPDVAAPTPPTRPTQNKVRTTGPEADPIGDIYRLSVLADRLHEHYCIAAPTRGIGCNTNSPAK